MWNRLQKRQINVTNILHASFELSWDVRTGSLEACMSCLSVTMHRSSHSLTFLQNLASRSRLQIKFSLLCGERNKRSTDWKDIRWRHFIYLLRNSVARFKQRHLVIFPAYIRNFNRLKYAYRSHIGNIWHTVWQQERNTNGDKKGMCIYILMCSSFANSHTWFSFMPPRCTQEFIYWKASNACTRHETPQIQKLFVP
jgi:hypothetical protein